MLDNVQIQFKRGTAEVEDALDLVSAHLAGLDIQDEVRARVRKLVEEIRDALLLDEINLEGNDCLLLIHVVGSLLSAEHVTIEEPHRQTLHELKDCLSMAATTAADG